MNRQLMVVIYMILLVLTQSLLAKAGDSMSPQMHEYVLRCEEILAGKTIPDKAMENQTLASLLQASYIGNGRLYSYLTLLEPIANPSRVQSDLGIDLRRVEQLAKAFSYEKSARYPVRMEITLFERSDLKEPHVVALGTFYSSSSSEPIGVWSSTLTKCPEKGLFANSDYMKINPNAKEARGISEVFHKWYTEQFLKPIGVVRERVIANWTGRLVWARLGYQFDESVTPIVFYEETSPGEWTRRNSIVSQIELVRDNLRRFLKLHNIDEQELAIRTGNNMERINSIDDLASPEDFVNLIHINGKTISIKPHLDEEVIGKTVSLPIGKAFALQTSTPQEDQRNRFTVRGQSVSDHAMPTWVGVRILDRSIMGDATEEALSPRSSATVL
ncbi:MAG: hypothetical protein HYY62_04810 [Deltaproteobacteria bacterium]|nr:hypothetical protein [Deltaproteobacteria bacterium]